jgi:glutamyl-tRNA synthetase
MNTVRFAPSPTGHLHIGGVRTALFNYFFIKKEKGRFVLRIEDTDIARSSHEMAEEIIRGLQWLGIRWDDGPFYQSHRFDIYKKNAYRLLDGKKAYRCFCTPEEIDERRKAASADEKIYKYDRNCLELSEDQIAEKVAAGIPFVVRFRIPEGATYFKDSLHKEMKSENVELEDFVILKSDNSPTYHLSVVVDDSDMGITHVIRGDDHLSNTFKQVLLFKALDLKPPKYAHLPLILGPDKKKLSKRHGETSVLEFKKSGYLPEAIVNYLSQLSWIPADSKEVFSIDELAARFSLAKLSKSSPVFDYDKLRFLNSRVIQGKDAETLNHLLMENETFRETYANIDEKRITALIELIKPRMKTLTDFGPKFDIYLGGLLNYDNSDLLKLNETFPNHTIISHLKLFLEKSKCINPFDAGSVETGLRECAETNGLKAADLIHPVRFALTSETVSPPVFDVLAFLGKEESIERIHRLVRFLESK